MIRSIRVLAIVSCFGLFTTACGVSTNGFETSASSANGSQAVVPLDPIAATNKDIATLNTRISGLNTSLTGSSGQLDLITLLNLQTQAGSGSSSTSSNKLSQAIGKLLDNLVAGATAVYNQIKTTGVNIQTRIAQLNPADATQAKVIAQLQTFQTDLVQFKTQVDTALNSLAAKMITLEAKVDSDIANMNSSSPLTWVVEVYWVPVKTQIQQHHDALVALTQ